MGDKVARGEAGVLPPGFLIGQWDDANAVTGCTVILCPPATVGGCEIRGSSPGSRETALLASEKTMQEVHALVLTGGSAFGLAAADGVMGFLEERGVGYPTPWGRVPIVPAAVIFDLNIGSSTRRPGREEGYAAARSASSRLLSLGNVGAGMGATVGKWGGSETRMKGGLGICSIVEGDVVVTALAVVNAVGDILDPSGLVLAGARSADGRWLADTDPRRTLARGKPVLRANTTLVALLTNAQISKVQANRLAQRGHDGMARAVKPVHTSYDGDVVFALAGGTVSTDFDLLAEAGADAAAEAIRSGVRNAASMAGVHGLAAAGKESPA